MWPFGRKRAEEKQSKPSPIRSARQSAANEVLQRYKGEGWPFVLYLRNFRVMSFHGDRSDGYLLWQYLQEEVPEGCGVFMIDDQNDAGIDVFSLRYGRTTPIAHAYRDDQWREQFLWLMRHAAMIVDEYYLESPGSRWELEQIAAAGLADKAVLVIPSPGGAMPTVDALPYITPFWRAVFRGELEGTNKLFGWRRAEDLQLRLAEICKDPKSFRPKVDGSPAELPSLFPDPAVLELFQAADHPYTIVNNLPVDSEGRFNADQHEGVVEALHIAYAHLQRFAVGLLRAAETERAGRLEVAEVHNLLMARLYSADMCTRARLLHTFSSNDAQIDALKTNLIAAGQLIERGAGMGPEPKRKYMDLLAKAAAPDRFWWVRDSAQP